MSQKECGCPSIVDAQWEGQVFNWKDKTFFVEDVSYFFSVPINVEKKVQHVAEAIEAKGYMLEEPLMILMQETSFSGKIYVAILPPEEPDPHVVDFADSEMHATVFTRAAPKIGPGSKAFKNKLKSQGKKVLNTFFWHVTCPECTMASGYKTVIFAQVDRRGRRS